MTILRQFEKFGSGLKKGLHSFGKTVTVGMNKAENFVKKHGAAIAQEGLGIIGKGAAIAAPLLVMSGVGAEFAPIALGVAAGAKAGQFAIKTSRRIASLAKSNKTKQLSPPPAPVIEKPSAEPVPKGMTRGAFGT